MPELWFPGAERWNTGSTNFWPMGGQNHIRRATHHTIQGDSIWGMASWLSDPRAGDAYQGYYHVGIDGQTGESVAFTTADRAARSMGNGHLFEDGCNIYGEVNIQVCWAGFAEDRPVANAKPEVKRRVMKWLRSWGIPDVMPHGNLGTINRSVDVWMNQSGHFSHGQAPGNNHTDPGWCSPEELFIDGVDDDMPLSAQFARGGFRLDPGQSVFLNWSRSSGDVDKIHREGQSRIGIPGLYQATLDLATDDAPLEASFCEVKDRDVKAADTSLVLGEKWLVSNSGTLQGGRVLKVRLSNPNAFPVTVSSAKLRLQYWEN